ncbi:MAG: FmdB family transcriptional regulator [Streptomyces sp.]|nr:FmdB family transcriptional regulator [Streptomyces sp.]
MPTYQYQCTECGEALEAVQKFSDDALTECPNCGGRLRKVFSAVGVVFKGSGFYRTDSRGSSSGSAPAAKTSGSESKSSDSASKSSSTSTSGSSSTSSSSSPSSSSTSAA